MVEEAEIKHVTPHNDKVVAEVHCWQLVLRREETLSAKAEMLHIQDIWTHLIS